MGIQLVVFMIVASVGGFLGYRIADYNHQRFLVALSSQHLKDLEKAQKAETIVVERYIYVDRLIEKATKPIIRNIYHEVEKPVYSQCIVPDTGRVLLDQLIDETNTAVATGTGLPTTPEEFKSPYIGGSP